MVEKQTDKSIKALRSDREEKYLTSEFLDHLKENNFLFEWISSYTPPLSSIVERKNRTLLNMVWSMMCFMDLSISF